MSAHAELCSNVRGPGSPAPQVDTASPIHEELWSDKADPDSATGVAEVVEPELAFPFSGSGGPDLPGD